MSLYAQGAGRSLARGVVMGLVNESALSCCQVAPRRWWVVPVACLQALEVACTTEVDLFRSHDSRSAATTVAAASAATANTATTAAAAGTGTSNSTTILIEPGRPAANPTGSCQPGHYVGSFGGMYNAAVLGNGALPLTIAATPSMGRPGLEFWLESIPRNCRSDEEFCADFTVKGGKIRGYSNPFSTGNESSNGSQDPLVVAIRFEIDFGGTLDCSRGTFRGLLRNGCYDVATVLFRFEGDAPANYDAATSSFTNGMWTVKELPSDEWPEPTADLGGMGSWQASWANDAEGPAAESVGLCGMPAAP